MTAKEMRDRIATMLGHPSGPILEKLVTIHPRTIERKDLAAHAGYGNPRSGNFVTAIGRLKSLGFIEFPNSGTVKAGAVLFKGV